METLLYLALFAVALVAMTRFGCGAHAMGHGRHRHGPSRDEGQPRWVAPEKDNDPVCGMVVDTAGAKSAVHAGNVYYFCSPACRDKFETSPATYARAASADSEHKEHRHGGCC